MYFPTKYLRTYPQTTQNPILGDLLMRNLLYREPSVRVSRHFLDRQILDCMILDHYKVYPWKQNIDHEQWLFNVEMFILKSRSKNTTLWYRPCSPIYVYFCNNLFAINNFLSCSQQCNCSRLQQCFSCHAVQILLFCQCLSDCNMKIITVEQKQVQ